MRQPVLSLIVITLTLVGASAEAAPPQVLSWLQEQAVPFTSTDAGAAPTDLEPLEGLVGDARIVGLGEATHGTHEFFTTKHRLIRFLVTEVGFDTIVLEDAFEAGLALNDYVLHGRGDPEALLQRGSWNIWQTQEMAALLRWLRTHNENPGDAPRVRFYGMDPGGFPNHRAVVTYLRGVDTEAAAQVARWFDCLTQFDPSPNAYAAQDAPTRIACRRKLHRAQSLMETNRADYVTRSSEQAYLLAKQRTTQMVGFERLAAAYDPESLNVTFEGIEEIAAIRDEIMADNVRWLAEEMLPEGKLIVWAHNGHIDAQQMGMFPLPSLGTHLRARYGAAYRPVALAFYEGTFNAFKLGPDNLFLSGFEPQRLAKPGPESYEAAFASVGPRFVLDLRSVPSGPEGAWLRGPRPLHHHIGGSIYAEHPERSRYDGAGLTQSFDLLVFIHTTSPSRLLAPQPNPLELFDEE